MANSPAQDFMDTVQLVPGQNGVPAVGAGPDPIAPVDGTGIWPEAADFQCSESASLFAGTQPAPLTVV